MEGTILLILIVLSILSIFATIVFFFYYIGYFYKVRVTAGPSIVSELRVAYKLHSGNYAACEPHFTEITQICPEKRTLGIFYDDPNKVDPNSCRYIVGVILVEGSRQKPDSDLEKKLEEHKFKFADFPKVDFSVKTSHPFPVAYSAGIGAAKAYPAMEKYIKSEKLCAHPFLEIYDDDTIHYMVPLSKQADFYVDEVRDILRKK